MINLANTSSYFKKIILWIAVSILVILLVVLIGLQFTSKGKVTPPQVKPLKPLVILGPKIEALRFNTSNLHLPINSPESLPVYEIGQKENFLTNAPSLAATLGFNQPPDETDDASVGKKLTYTNNDVFLIVFENGFSYTDLSKALPDSGQFVSPTDLSSYIRTFLRSLNINFSAANNPQISYKQNFEEFDRFVNTPAEANLIVTKQSYEISGLKIVGPNASVSAIFNKTNELREIVYNQFAKGTELDIYPLFSAGDSLKSLIAGKGTLIEATSTVDYVPIPSQVNSVDINSMYLAYWQPSEVDQVIQPVWVFEGITQTNTETASLIYIIPAIKSQFFTGP